MMTRHALPRLFAVCRPPLPAMLICYHEVLRLLSRLIYHDARAARRARRAERVRDAYYSPFEAFVFRRVLMILSYTRAAFFAYACCRYEADCRRVARTPVRGERRRCCRRYSAATPVSLPFTPYAMHERLFAL